MRIIRQFKQGRTPQRIYKSLRMGDVFVLAGSGVRYIAGGGGYIISEIGYVYPSIWHTFFEGKKMKAIYKRENGTGEFLEDLLIAAENDIRKGWLK